MQRCLGLRISHNLMCAQSSESVSAGRQQMRVKAIPGSFSLSLSRDAMDPLQELDRELTENPAFISLPSFLPLSLYVMSIVTRHQRVSNSLVLIKILLVCFNFRENSFGQQRKKLILLSLACARK